MVVVPLINKGGVVGTVVKQTSPLIMVCGAVLELVKVLETTPNVPAAPSEGAVAAETGADAERSAANPVLAKRTKCLRIMLHLHLVTARPRARRTARLRSVLQPRIHMFVIAHGRR